MSIDGSLQLIFKEGELPFWLFRLESANFALDERALASAALVCGFLDLELLIEMLYLLILFFQELFHLDLQLSRFLLFLELIVFQFFVLFPQSA